MSAAQAGESSAADVTAAAAAAGNLHRCVWFVWQGFGSDGATAVAPVRHWQKVPPCLTKQMPDGSSKDPMLAKAEHISPGGCTSGITGLRRGKNKRAEAAGRQK